MHHKMLFLLWTFALALLAGCGTTSGHYAPPSPFPASAPPAASAALAFSRSFLFTVASIQIMPVLLGGVTGVWLATPAAELLGAVMAAAAAAKYRGRYGY